MNTSLLLMTWSPLAAAYCGTFINASTRKVGGLRFFKVGRFCVSFCITRQYSPLASE